MAVLDALGYENIEIVSPYVLQQLNELKIERRVNCHSTFFYTGIIPEEKKDSYIQQATPDDVIEVNIKDGMGVVRPLFKGLISNISVKAVQGIYYLEVEGISCSAMLDTKLRKRSFQNKAFKDIFNEVVSIYSGGAVKDCVTDGAKVEFVVQYDETDWSFLKRLVSGFNTVLVPYDLVNSPKLWFGLPDETEEEIILPEDLWYRVKKDFVSYTELHDNHLQSVTDADFTAFVVQTEQYYLIGAKVSFHGAKLIVAQSTAELQDGVLKFEYLLCPEGGLKQKPILNHRMVGATLQGKVIDIEKDMVRLHLAIDQKQDKETARWFPYATCYTAEGNSGFYCMPLLGDQSNLYFPTGRELDAVVLNSVRQDKESCPKTQNPDVKYWGTNHGKELMMSGKELKLTAKDGKDGKILIKLDDEKGIEIRSDSELFLTARKNLTFDLEKKASIKAKDEIQLICGSCSIDMDGITHLKGPKVTVEPRR